MNPIVDPSIIYLISVIAKLNVFFQLLVVFLTGIILLELMVLTCFLGCKKEEDIEFRNSLIKKIKYTVMVWGIASIIFLFIPDKITMIGMLVSVYITPDNIMMSEENLVEIVNKIIKATSNAKW